MNGFICWGVGGKSRFGVTIVLIGKKGIIYRKNYNLNIFQTAEKGLQVFLWDHILKIYLLLSVTYRSG